MTGYRTYGDSKGIRQTVWDLSTNYQSGNSAKRKKLDQEIEQDKHGKKYHDNNHNCPITATQHNDEPIKTFSSCTLLKARPILRELSNITSSANNCTRIHTITYTNRSEQKVLKLCRVKTDLLGRFPRDQATETSGHL